MLIFALLIFILSLLTSLKIAKFISHPKTIFLSYIFGSLIFYTLDFISPYSISHSSLIDYSILLSVVGLVLVVINEKLVVINKTSNIWSLLRSKLKVAHMKYIIAYFALFLYFFLALTFFYSFSLYNFNLNMVPLWFLPLKLGVAGILSLIGLFYSIKKGNGVYFFIVLCISTLLIQLFLYHLPYSLVPIAGIEEFRIFRDVLWPF